MMIEGVRSIKSKTIKSFQIQLDPSFTNGHDFCELTIDEDDNRFAARFYGNEFYSYAWNNPGSFIPHLIDVFSNHGDHLFNKIADYSLSDFVDTEKTADNLKKKLLEARYNRELDENEAREAWEGIETLGAGDRTTSEHFIDLYFVTLEEAIKKNVFSHEPWFEDFIEYQEDWKCRVFCEKVAPILAEVLKKEYGR